MSSGSDHQKNSRFRAPQFALHRPDAAASLAEDEAGFEAGPASPEAPSASPKVVIRRRRQLELPDESTRPLASASSDERRPRTFVVARPPEEVSAALPPDDRAPGVDGRQAAPSQPAASPSRRRRAPLVKRAGPVTVMHPEPTAGAGAAPVPPPSLSDLQQELATLAVTLEALRACTSKVELDLSIHDRWGSIDTALQALRDSLPPARRLSADW